jgi:hypothetical protein
MLEMDLLESAWKLWERDPEVPAWGGLTAEQKDEFDLKNAQGAACCP